MSIKLSSPEGYSEVGNEISLEDAATILEHWQHSIKTEDLFWRDVVGVYELDPGEEGTEYGFLCEEGFDGNFNIIEWLSERVEDNLELNVLNIKSVLGRGRGTQGIAHDGVQASVILGGDDAGYIPEDQDDEATGFLDGDPMDDVKVGTQYLLEIIRSGQTFTVGESDQIIGRGNRGVNVQILGNKGISRVHTKMWVEGDELHVEDQGSSGGTFVNNIQTSGDTVVSVGESVYLYNEQLKVVEIL